MKTAITALTVMICLLFLQPVFCQRYGVFDGSSDVGAVKHAGHVVYQPLNQQYMISGSGANIWFASDQFHYAWKKISGDFILHTRCHFNGKGTDPHRKMGWMVRASLDSNAVMVTATVHGDGLTSLQFRKTIGGNVEEIRSPLNGAEIIQLERKGNRLTMAVAHDGDTLQRQEIVLDIPGNIYAGLFVCSHNKDITETAVFDNVQLIKPARENFIPYREYIGSHIELMNVSTRNRVKVYSDTVSLQAPNWTKDGKTLIFNSKGLLYRFELNKKTKPKTINTGFVKNNNNDHVISFDGKMLGLSSSSGEAAFGSLIYTVPVAGGVPTRITKTGPSYLHGWSPDGKYLVFTGQRNNDFDIYRIPADGGEELRLTTAPGLDDGPEYSPDGRYIYFNSLRAGHMQIFRMNADGTNQQQLTSDGFNNWFPHISPDGRSIVFLSFPADVKPDDHPFYKQVYLRMIPVSDQQQKPTVIAYVYGGQGTINTPSWSPDSKKIAFVSNSDVVKSWE